MADVDGDSVDLETLQAQIDMSMAFTHNLVSGWMKASKVKLPSARANDDQELEEYMRKPPRLGVGASVPESTGVLGRETAKLRNKLVGNGKKRQREDDEASAAPASKAIVISDDEEDSRARVITKKARPDPFAPKLKEKKRSTADPPRASASVPAAAASPVKKTADHPREGTALDESQKAARTVADLSSEGAVVSSTPAKRRKKRKHKGEAAEGTSSFPDPSATTASTPASQVHASAVSKKREVIDLTVTDKSVSPLSTPTTTRPADIPPLAGVSLKQAALPASKSSSAPARPATPVPQPSPQRLDPFGLPLLNVAGPPPSASAADTQPSSPKKKRKKRKKKKKKTVAEAAIHPEHVDVDAEGDGDDDDEDD